MFLYGDFAQLERILYGQAVATTSGIKVSDSDLMGLPAAYAAVRAISETVAQLPLRVFEKSDSGKITEVREHAGTELLGWDRPNNYQTPYDFVQLMQSRLCIRHNAYAKIEKDRRGRVRNLMPINPNSVTMQLDEQTGAHLYTLNWEEGDTETDVHPDHVLHVRGFSMNGFLGWALMGSSHDAIGQMVATDRLVQTALGNGPHLPGFLRAPRVSDKQIDMLSEVMRQSRGVQQAGKIPVYPGEVEFVKVGMHADEAQLLDSRMFNLGDTCRLFRVQPHLLFDLTNATYSNIEEQQKSFLDMTIMSWLTRWEQALRISLLTKAERKRNMYFHFGTDELLRARQLDRYKAYSVAINWGFMNRNEVRAKEDLAPAEGLDDFLQPVNMAIVGAEPEPEPKLTWVTMTKGTGMNPRKLWMNPRNSPCRT